MNVLPQNIAKCMSAEDRKAFGRGAMTAEEALARAEVRNERDLHKAIRGLLSLKGIEFIESRMDKRTTQKKGVPDFLFCVAYKPWGTPIAMAWECKFGNGKLSPEQEAMLERMKRSPNQWQTRIIRSFDEAILGLRELGIE